MNENDTPPPEPPQYPLTLTQRTLGVHGSADDGYVREILAILAMLFIHATLLLLLSGYLWGRGTDLKDFIIGWGVAVYSLDIAAVSWYFGKHSNQGG